MNGKSIKIQILLSTYNGERYLKEQLDSYLMQEGEQEVRVLIRDDGSTDGTMEILRLYERERGFRVLRGENIGVDKSMGILFQEADRDCDYFAVSDQDDVWCSDKLKRAIAVLEAKEAALPLLYASTSRLTDRELHPIGMTELPAAGPSYYNAVSQNICQGHTEVFNRALLQELSSAYPEEIHAVDWWIYLLASGLGEIVFDEVPTVLHRQHGINTVGYESNFRKKIRRRLIYIKNSKGAAVSRQLRAFFRLYGERLPAPYAEETKAYLSFEKSGFRRLSWLMKTKIRRQKNWETILFKYLYLTGKYDIEE